MKKENRDEDFKRVLLPVTALEHRKGKEHTVFHQR